MGPFPKKMALKKGLQELDWPPRKLFWLKHCRARVKLEFQLGLFDKQQSDFASPG